VLPGLVSSEPQRVIGPVFLEHVAADAAVREAAEVVPVFRTVALARPRKPVVHERQVFAAAQCPEERVVNRLAAQRGLTERGNQEPGGAVVLLRRVIQDRRVEHRHALDAEDRVPQERVVLDVQHDCVGAQPPARRGLYAGGEPALRNPVLARTNLLDDFADEVHVRVLIGRPRHDNRAWRRRLDRRFDVRDA